MSRCEFDTDANVCVLCYIEVQKEEEEEMPALENQGK